MDGGPNKRRLSRRDWVDAALDVLTESGISGVTIDRLAELLGVTRGSFYHHFGGREDLLKTMLKYWEENYTTRLREDVDSLRLPPADTLLALIRMIRHRHAASYDVWFRAWALRDPMAQKTVKRVDKLRLDFIRQQFEGIGFKGVDAESRARLFLYYEMAEPGIFAPQDPKLMDRLVEHRHKLLTTRE